jgi:uncharacterized protein (TIGR03000 family)
MARRWFAVAAVAAALVAAPAAARAQMAGFRGGLVPVPSLGFTSPFGMPVSTPYYVPYGVGLGPYSYGAPQMSPDGLILSDYLRAQRAEYQRILEAQRAQAQRYTRPGVGRPQGRPTQKIEEFDPPARDTRPAAEAPSKATAAQVEVRVPATAEVWFDGKTTSQTGEVRKFETPALPPGQAYTYEVRARWQAAGRDNDEIRKVTVRAGDQLTVDFAPALASDKPAKK